MKGRVELLKLVLPYFFVMGLVLPNIIFGHGRVSKVPSRETVNEIQTETKAEITTKYVESSDTTETTGKKIKKINFIENANGYKDGTYIGTAKGYGGDISVSVVISDGQIQSVIILSAAYETPSFFEKAKVLAGEIEALKSVNVDVVSGATYSSNGIIQAVINALKQAGADEASLETVQTSIKETTTKKEKTTSKPTTVHVDEGIYEDGKFTGIGEGYGGNIKVSVTIKNSKIIDIEIVSAKYETQEFFDKARNIVPSMKKQQTADVDVISGATYSSNGIKDAVNQALQKSIDKHNNKNEKTTASPYTEKKTEKQTEIETEPETSYEEIKDDGSVVTVSSENSEEKIIGAAVCYPDAEEGFEEYDIELEFVFLVKTVTITTTKNGETTTEQKKEYKLINIEVTDSTKKMAEKEGNWFFLNRAIKGAGSSIGMLEQLVAEGKNNQIDAVSGATCSSWAVFDAYTNAMSFDERNEDE